MEGVLTGRPCDYTGITYKKLRGGSGIQWPCNDANPDGTERLYVDGVFNTDPDSCETYGQDLATGAEFSEQEYRAKQPGGRAFLHTMDYQPSPEVTSDAYPLLLTTGRTVYQFHTRTKTGRAPQLNAAAPHAWVELNAADATKLGIAEGDLVSINSPRGAIQVRASIGRIRPGAVFVPFHYGYFDVDRADRTPRAANELTVTAWDPVSKQPLFKVAAVRVAKLADGDGLPSPAPTVGGSAPAGTTVPPTVGGPAAEATSRLGKG